MTARAEHRAARQSGEYFDRKIDEVQYAQTYERALHDANAKLDAHAAQVAELTACVGNLESVLADLQSLADRAKIDLDRANQTAREANERTAYWKLLCFRAQQDLQDLDAKHAKLSVIVRLALTPEQYHTYRNIVENEVQP